LGVDRRRKRLRFEIFKVLKVLNAPFGAQEGTAMIRTLRSTADYRNWLYEIVSHYSDCPTGDQIFEAATILKSRYGYIIDSREITDADFECALNTAGWFFKFAKPTD